MRPNTMVQYYTQPSLTVEPHQLEKGNITAHSGHWKQENTFLAKLWRYILGGLETQKFWISSFQRHAASGGFYNQSDAEKCNWQLWTCMKNVTPGLWPLQLFLMVAIHSLNWTLNLDLVMCTCISCERQPKNMIAQKNLYGRGDAGHSGSNTSNHMHVQAWRTFPLFLLPLKWGCVWVFPLGHEYYGIHN